MWALRLRQTAGGRSKSLPGCFFTGVHLLYGAECCGSTQDENVKMYCTVLLNIEWPEGPCSPVADVEPPSFWK